MRDDVFAWLKESIVTCDSNLRKSNVGEEKAFWKGCSAAFSEALKMLSEIGLPVPVEEELEDMKAKADRKALSLSEQSAQIMSVDCGNETLASDLEGEIRYQEGRSSAFEEAIELLSSKRNG